MKANLDDSIKRLNLLLILGLIILTINVVLTVNGLSPFRLLG